MSWLEGNGPQYLCYVRSTLAIEYMFGKNVARRAKTVWTEMVQKGQKGQTRSVMPIR